MTRRGASSCVYIGREGGVYKAVCGEVLTTSVHVVPRVIDIELSRTFM